MQIWWLQPSSEYCHMPVLPPASQSLLEWSVLIHSSLQQAFLEQLLILMLDVNTCKEEDSLHSQETHSILIKQYAKRTYDTIDSPP